MFLLLLSPASTGGSNLSSYIYQEKIFSRLNAVIFGVIILFLVFTLADQRLVDPVGSDPAPDWFFVLMITLFIAVGANFSTLTITIDYENITIGYGLIKNTIPRSNIEKCYIDETSSVLYGGWGIRIGRVKGNWRLIYNTVGAPRVVLGIRDRWYKEFVFSTQSPLEVKNVLGYR